MPNSNRTMIRFHGLFSERIAELTDYSHLAMARSCGGSHTMTSSSQRRSGLQYVKHHSQPEADAIVQVRRTCDHRTFTPTVFNR